MKICTVVCNSVWFDPRVIKQIESYKMQKDVELCCVGIKCERYDKARIDKCGVPMTIVEIPSEYSRAKRMANPLSKIKREMVHYELLRDAIVAYKPDIIHANDLDAFIPAMMAAKKIGCKVVYDSHEVYVENYAYAVAGNRLFGKVLKFIESKLVKHCAQMVCVSHAAAEYFARTYGIEQPMVVTNCVSRNKRSMEEKKTEGFEVLNHGKFAAARGYDLMAKACANFAEYPEIKLAIRGIGNYESVVRGIVEKAPNKEQFIFYPPVTAQELVPAAAKSHVGVAITEPVCLNFELSVSNKLFEYAAAGLPVILSDIPEHRYLNEKYDFGLIIPENTPEAFAQAVIRLYTDHELYERLSKNALRLSEEVNWENEFERLLEAERAMVGGK